jgi:diaminopimelate epimerase
MCGNGIRCVAKYVYDHGIARKPELQIETGAGVLQIGLEVIDDKVVRARVDMGEPILDGKQIPTTIDADQIVNVPLPLLAEIGPVGWQTECGLDPRMTCVSMGNPHVVFYCEDVAKVPLTQVGPKIETASTFPRKVNVHFVQVHSPSEVTMRTWERGSGITLACGTGASAVGVAGVLTGRTKRRILAHLPGGDLELEWADDRHVFMTGPATEVFSGIWPQ